MLTKLKETIKKLESSKIFKDYKKTNPDAYLTSTFLMTEDIEGDWQLDYYSIKSKKITSFIIKDKVKGMPETKPFQEKESIIEKLGNKNFNRIKIGIQTDKLEKIPAEDYVLMLPAKNDRARVKDQIKKAAEAAKDILESGLEKSMNKWNSK